MRHQYNYNQRVFNDLSTIESANARMKEEGKLAAALAAFGPVFTRHRMYERFGINLLHKHYDLLDDEVPIQEVTTSNSGKEYITRPQSTSELGVASPCVYRVCEGGLSPLEYSTDGTAREANEALTANPNFVRDFCEAADENQLAPMFGLIVMKRPTRGNSEFVENNYSDRVSILSETDSPPPPQKLIETSWVFSADVIGMACVAKCMSYCTVSGTGHTKGHSPPYHDPNGMLRSAF